MHLKLRYCLLEHINGFSEVPFWLWIWSPTHSIQWLLIINKIFAESSDICCDLPALAFCLKYDPTICAPQLSLWLFFLSALPVANRSALYVGKLDPLWGKWFAAKLHVIFNSSWLSYWNDSCLVTKTTWHAFVFPYTFIWMKFISRLPVSI